MTIVVITGHDLTPFSIAFGSIITSAAGFLAILPVLRRQGQQLDMVKRQTNGTLSKLLADKKESDVRLALALSLMNEGQAKEVLDHTMGREELLQFLRQDAVTVASQVTPEE